MKTLPLEYAARNLGRSPVRLGLWVIGSALVVLLILGAAGFVTGMSRSLRAGGEARNVILLGAGSEESTERSEISPAVAALVEAGLSGIGTVAGAALVSPEVHVGLPLRVDPEERKRTQVLVRGVTERALLVHPKVRVVLGRFPRPGADELMVGGLVGAKLGVPEAALAVGRTVWVDKKAWTIVGRFAAPGSVMESEAWAPLSDLKQALKRESDSCVVLTLGSGEFADVDSFAKQRLDLELSAIRETDYYVRLEAFFRPVRVAVWLTAGMIALGGLLGGMNTMYAAFASRVRELGMLRCLGFRRGAVLLSLVQEALIATAAGSLLACAAGAWLLHGVSVRLSLGAFGLAMDGPVLATGLGAGLFLGLMGAIAPAWAALRKPIPEALKAA